MKIFSENGLKLGTDGEMVSIGLTDYYSSVTGEQLVISMTDCYLRLDKMKGANVFKLMIWKDKRSYDKVVKEHYKYVKGMGEEYAKDIERVEKNWEGIFRGGKEGEKVKLKVEGEIM